MNLLVLLALLGGVSSGEKIVIGTNNPKKASRFIFII
jgi:hypothetical protein